jgi:hypothetical protein
MSVCELMTKSTEAYQNSAETPMNLQLTGFFLMTRFQFVLSVEISDAGRHETVDDDVNKQRSKIMFGLGELERQTDSVVQHM